MNKMELVNIAMFVVGWLLFVLAQIQNSVLSSTNSLQGKDGWLSWLKLHAIELALRAFGSGLLYTYIVHYTADKLSAIGLSLGSTAYAGFGGIAANSVLYQFFGLVPWLRVEVAHVSPPMNPPAEPPKGP